MLTHASLLHLCRARDRLRDASDERAPTIDELAREAGLSTGQFIRQFSAVFGETPHQLRIEARLAHAKSLLAAGDHSVTDVCMAVGFSSLGTFSDLFTRRVGIAPSAYRRRIHAPAWFPTTSPTVVFPGCFDLMCAAFARLRPA